MDIAVIGTGNIGTAIATRLSLAGHSIIFGSEHPEAAADLAHRLKANARGVAEAISAGEVVIVTIPFGIWPEFARRHGAALKGKVVLDTTNTNAGRDGAIVDEVERDGRGTLAFVGDLVPGARVVKAFNTMQSGVLAGGGDRPGGRLAYPLAGDDDEAVMLAKQLVEDAGFDAVLVGDALSAKTFDEGTAVWNHPANAEQTARTLSVRPS